MVRKLDEEASHGAVNLILLNKFQKQLNHEDGNMILTGNAVCLTSAEMVAKAREAKDKKVADVAAKAVRKSVRESADVVWKAWAGANKARKDHNCLVREAFVKAKARYGAQKV